MEDPVPLSCRDCRANGIQRSHTNTDASSGKDSAIVVIPLDTSNIFNNISSYHYSYQPCVASNLSFNHWTIAHLSLHVAIPQHISIQLS